MPSAKFFSSLRPIIDGQNSESIIFVGCFSVARRGRKTCQERSHSARAAFQTIALATARALGRTKSARSGRARVAAVQRSELPLPPLRRGLCGWWARGSYTQEPARHARLMAREFESARGVGFRGARAFELEPLRLGTTRAGSTARRVGSWRRRSHRETFGRARWLVWGRKATPKRPRSSVGPQTHRRRNRLGQRACSSQRRTSSA